MVDAKKISFGIGIAIVIALFAGFGADYIGNYFQDKCGVINGGYCYSIVVKTPEGNACQDLSKDLCTGNSECVWEDSINYSDECRQTRQTAFAIFATIIGIIALISGFMIKNNAALNGGLTGGGIVSLIIAVISYWSRLDELMRVILLFILVVVLIVIAYKKLNDKG